MQTGDGPGSAWAAGKRHDGSAGGNVDGRSASTKSAGAASDLECASVLHRLIVMPEPAQASRRRSFEGGQPRMRWTGPPLQCANVKGRV